MRVLVCGDKNWKNEERVKEVLATVGARVLILMGNGELDEIVKRYAESLGLMTIVFPKTWHSPEGSEDHRTEWILEIANVEVVLGFHTFIARSKETKAVLDRALCLKAIHVLVDDGKTVLDMRKSNVQEDSSDTVRF